MALATTATQPGSPRALLFRLSLLTILSLFALPSTAQNPTKTTTTTAPPTAPSTPPSSTDHAAFASAILRTTNAYRAAHNASALCWNATLASFAASYLATTTTTCADGVLAHSGGPYGENLALGYADAAASVAAWGDEGGRYDFDRPGFRRATGHFTQLVWRASTDVGCARRLCGARRGWYLACEYWPPGNVLGAFRDEVGRPVDSAAAPPPLRGRGRGRVGASAVLVAAGVVFWMFF